MRKTFVLGLAALATATPVPAADGQEIVGGSGVSSPSKYPFIAAMTFEGSFDCGGTVLSETKILTAAHCSVLGPPSSYTWRVGSINYGQDGIVARVSNISVNPNYDANTTDYDVAVMTLDTPLTFSSTVKAANLVSSGAEPADGCRMTAIGWGRTREGGQPSETLRQVTLPMVPRSNCSDEYGGNAVITDRMFCAAAAGKDSCNGDSGGPIFDAQDQILYGSVSWGFGCADPAYPGVYADYANEAINEWIKEQL